jgi:hypothetical protein
MMIPFRRRKLNIQGIEYIYMYIPQILYKSVWLQLSYSYIRVHYTRRYVCFLLDWAETKYKLIIYK